MSGPQLIQAFVQSAVQGLAKLPDKTNVQLVESSGKMLCLVIHCDPQDAALVIGRHGKNIKAIRDLTWAIAAKHSFKATVIVNE